MSHFDEYKQAKKQDHENLQALPQYYENVRQRSFPELGPNNHMIDYDADQLMEYFEDRNASAEDFETRTSYYFKDAQLGASKQQQYQRYANNENGITSAYSRRYGNHYAWKRKSNASSAVKHFRTMNQRMAAYARDDDLNVDSYTKYLHREEIMKYRLKGMIAAAETKSKSKVHEAYLKGRAKLSCNMLLKDQLQHLILGEENAELKGRLESKLAGLERKIKSAYEEIKNSSPSVQDTWKDVHDINKTTIQAKQREYRKKCGVFDLGATNMLLNLEKLQSQAQAQNAVWPCGIVLKDKVGGPLNRAEARKEQFAQTYRLAQQDGDQETLKKMEGEGIKRFMKMHLPGPDELADRSLVKYISAHSREYYELTKLALPYYQKKMREKDGSFREYANSHPDFLKRLYYADAVNKYIDFALRHDYLIMYDEKDKFKIEADPRYRFEKRGGNGDWARQERFGEGQDMQKFDALRASFSNYNRANYVPKLREERKNRNLINNDGNIIIAPKIRKINIISHGMSEKDYDEEDDLIIKTDNKPLINIINNENDNLINNIEDEKLEDNIIIKEKHVEKEDDKEEKPGSKKVLGDVVEENDFDAPLNINQLIKEREAEEEENKKKREEKKKRFESRKENVKKENIKKEDIKKEDIKEDNQKSNKQDKTESKKDADNIIINKETQKNLNSINIINEEEEIELSKEEEAEYRKLCQNNPRVDFSREDYLVYKTIVDAHMVSKSVSNQKAMDKGVEDRVFVGAEQISLSKLSKAPAPLLKSLRFQYVTVNENKNGQTKRRTHEKGIKPEDEQKRIKNRTWIGFWVSTDKYAARENYIKANLPKMFDDFQWPTVEELADGTALKGERLFEIMDMIRRARGLDYLRFMSKAAGTVIDDPGFSAKIEVLKNIENYVTMYLRLNRHIDISQEKGDDVRLYNNKYESKKDLKDSIANYLKSYEEKIKLLPKDAFLKKTAAVKKEENLNKINIISEEKKEVKKVPASKKECEKVREKFKEFNDGLERFKDHPEYVKLIKNANNHLLKVLAGKTVDRAVMHMFKYVNFDKNGAPISETDKKNHEWNKKFLRTFSGINGDFDTMGQMLKEYMPHAYDDMEDMPPLPKMTVNLDKLDEKKKKEVIKEYREQLDQWCEKLIRENKFKMILYNAKKGLSIDNLKKKLPGIREYTEMEKNPKYAAMGEILSAVHLYFENYTEQRYLSKFNGSEAPKTITSTDSLAEIHAENLFKNMTIYEQHKNDKDIELDTSKLKTLDTEFQKDKEFFDLKKQAPDFTREGFALLKRYETVTNQGDRELYKSAYKKAEPELKKYVKSGGVSFDRSAILLMKPVVYSKDGTPSNKKMAANEEWNVKWIKAWEDKDYDTREEMLAEYYPKVYDSLADIPIPDKKQVANPKLYMEVINKWIDNKAEKDSISFFTALRCDLAVDTTKNAHPSITQYIKADKKFASLCKSVTYLTQYVSAYITSKYKINMMDGRGRVVEEGSNQAVIAETLKEPMLAELVKSVAEYGKLKNNKSLPYKKMKK